MFDESEKSIFKNWGIGILFSNKMDDVIILFLAFINYGINFCLPNIISSRGR